MKTSDNQDFILPAGRYLVTDPCYVVPDRGHNELTPLCYDKKGGCLLPKMVEDEGIRFFIWGTAFGDGMYELIGARGGCCCVDSGTLAIIPVPLLEKWGVDIAAEKKRGLGVFVTMKERFRVKHNAGDVGFGEYLLVTSDILTPDCPGDFE